MNNTLTVIATRLGKKLAVIKADEKKISNLEHQIALYTNAIEKTKDSMTQRQSEVDYLQELQVEATELSQKVDELRGYTDGLRTKFDAYPWSPDMPWEHKLDSTDYAEKTREMFGMIDRLAEIEKLANKAYFRR